MARAAGWAILWRMPSIIIRPDWWLPEKAATPENVFVNRRRFVKQLGLAGAGLLSSRFGRAADAEPYGKGYPHPRNKAFDPGWALTDEKVASSYNNFYEFTLRKDAYKHVGKFQTSPWKVEISGLVEKPVTLDMSELLALAPLEERVYRFRCVEAWAMIVPWTGFPLSKLVEKVQPKPEAKFLRFVTAAKRDEMPGISENPEYPWPYFEGLRMDEAMHPLTLLVTGIYGKPLAKQFGAPVRVVVPWKYGYKSPKSLVKIEFVAQQPKTFWETLIPREYPFESNVDPGVPHPRWSQATERMIDSGDRVKTKKYNGYADAVSALYA